jgi:flagellar motor switch protein FliM
MEKIAPYNFKNNVFLSNTQLDFIEKIHHGFAEQAASSLSILLHEKVNVALLQTEQIPLSLFLRSHSMQCCYSFLSISSLSKSSILTISSELSYAIVAKLLGGDSGFFSNVPSFSPLEIAILRQSINAFLQPLKETWQPYIDFTTHINEIGTDLSRIERLQKTSKFVVLTFKTTILEVSGFISLLYPCESLYHRRDVLVSNESTALSNHSIDPQSIELSVKAILGSSNLTPQELHNLKKGDILKLEQLLNQPISVFVENIYTLNGYPGLTYKNKGVTLYARS